MSTALQMLRALRAESDASGAAVLRGFFRTQPGEYGEGDRFIGVRIADMLLDHPHDLIHKAAGWMLREAGKRDGAALRRFLASRHARMPRTMLRYAIEKFPERERRSYLTPRR